MPRVFAANASAARVATDSGIHVDVFCLGPVNGRPPRWAVAKQDAPDEELRSVERWLDTDDFESQRAMVAYRYPHSMA